MKCSCGYDEVVHDSAKGEYTCKNCGKVLEENVVVSEITFANSSVQGKFGKQGQDYTSIKCLMGYSKDAKEIRLAKVNKQIDQLAANLKLSSYQADAAKRYFKGAHHKNFTKGRHTSYVIAACIYVVCRQEKPPIPLLLIDLSDALQTNLYVLGAVYLKFVKLFGLELPLIDPSLFIHRFCAKLEFGDKTNEVSITALRLLQRMKRDWISYGRRPNSLCGAAIYIAAKIHGFKRTTNQIVQSVHVCDETIRKRLEEFKKTSVAGLTREEFERIDLEKDLEGELDPPSFKPNLALPQITVNHEKECEIAYENWELGGKTAEEIPLSLIDKMSESANFNNMALSLVKAIPEEENKIALKPEKTYTSTIDNYSENLDDIPESEIEQFLLTPEEQAVKSILWHHIHKEWIEEQSLKKEYETDKKASIKRRKRKVKEMIDAPDPITALTKSSKLGSRIDFAELSNLFDEQIIKKIKTEDPVLEKIF
jgi:transcription factor IIIB subunit 2